MTVAPICSGSSKPISRKCGHSTGLLHASAKCASDTAPAARHVAARIRLGGAAVHAPAPPRTVDAAVAHGPADWQQVADDASVGETVPQEAEILAREQALRT